jgi:hypothetical protein
MKLTRNFVLPIAALLFGIVLVPRASAVGVANCPTEPKQGVPIASGDTFSGSNCVLNTPGDIDGFTFSANTGDTYQFALAWQGGATNVCLTLYDPNSNPVIPQTCTNANGIVIEKTLVTTGNYSINITEPTGGGQAVDAYALSLERINPFPPDALPLALSDVVSATLAPTEQNAFTFYGATTGTYQVTLTYTGGPINPCVYLYSPGTTTANPLSGCTNSDSYQFQFKPTQNDTYMLLVNGEGNNATLSYNLEVTCLIGNCTQTYPPCTLKNTLTYNATNSTLTMNFTVGNNVATTWNAWLTDQNTITQLFSATQPITVPPVTIPKTTTLSPEGTVGVLSTLTTPTKGIFCSSYVQINTGKP